MFNPEPLSGPADAVHSDARWAEDRIEVSVILSEHSSGCTRLTIQFPCLRGIADRRG